MIRNRKNYDNSKHQLLSSNNDINNNYNSFQIENDTIEKYIENKVFEIKISAAATPIIAT